MSTDEFTFKDLCISKKFTRQKLANDTGISLDSIGRIYRGEISGTSVQLINKISDILNVNNDVIWRSIKRSKIELDKKKEEKQNKSDIIDDYKIKYITCENIFLTLASQNARCDVDIFHDLFVDIPREKKARLVALKSCIQTVRSNLIDVLDAARAMFEAMTGEQCRACIQIMALADGALSNTGSIQTVQRDTQSAGHRPHMGPMRAILGNTINESIFLNNQREIIIIDDILSKIAEGSFKTTSEDAGKIYNHVFIVPITPIHPIKGLEMPEKNQVATLCIDNMRGFRNDRIDILKRFAKELAWRISAMLYRLSRLVSETEILNNTRKTR